MESGVKTATIAILVAALTPFVTGTGTLLTLGLGFVFASLALGFDITFGFTGLLSFGLVLYFAIGVYVFDITLSVWNWPLLPAIAITLVIGATTATVLGALSLRVRGIAFTMVTLAFAQAGYYLIEDNPHNLTGGDTGQVLTTTRLPAELVGVASTRNLYWLALIFLVVIYALTKQATESVTGKVWLAIRESEQRTEVLGLKPFRYKLAALTLSSVIATAAGMVYLLLIGTATPDATAATTVTVEILVMVVLGGLGTRWGAVAGAIVYIYLQQELLKFAAEPSFANLPAPLRVPLSQPGFLLGALFIVFILFVPGGIASVRPAVIKQRGRS
jgi:branched-chain amino acid transport system permease protein